ncbi:MAG: hypothetical protein EBT92_18310 [Planctomycetes bacterium]|nr:hypothetical protein [Planctomycetota bacterium]NBY01172.1 hypothetical protein [Planctomycetota bacterium]
MKVMCENGKNRRQGKSDRRVFKGNFLIVLVRKRLKLNIQFFLEALQVHILRIIYEEILNFSKILLGI